MSVFCWLSDQALQESLISTRPWLKPCDFSGPERDQPTTHSICIQNERQIRFGASWMHSIESLKLRVSSRLVCVRFIIRLAYTAYTIQCIHTVCTPNGMDMHNNATTYLPSVPRRYSIVLKISTCPSDHCRLSGRLNPWTAFTSAV